MDFLIGLICGVLISAFFVVTIVRPYMKDMITDLLLQRNELVKIIKELEKRNER